MVQLPTLAEVGGDFSANGAFGGAISDQFVADALNGRPGCTAAIQNHGGTVPAAGVGWSTYTDEGGTHPGVFTNTVTGLESQIPTACMDPVAQNLLQYLPAANLPGRYIRVCRPRPTIRTSLPFAWITDSTTTRI